MNQDTPQAPPLQSFRKEKEWGGFLFPGEPPPGGWPILGRTPEMIALYEKILKVAPTLATVLILGESGSGKEAFARLIQWLSSRRHRPFKRAECSSLPETLIESELFGHEQGAFSGALQEKQGRFELANGGTLFLDEVGDYSEGIQRHLRRFLQDREYERVGGSVTRTADVRVIAATNRDLQALIREGLFRQDFFYRLNVVKLEVPPLRRRPDEIPLLVDRFLRNFSARHDVEAPRIAPAALDRLLRHSWPGNVRELENSIERMVVLGQATRIEEKDIESYLEVPPRDAAAPANDPLPQDWRRRAIEQAKVKHGNNKTAMAKELNIDRRTLYRWLAASAIPV